MADRLHLHQLVGAQEDRLAALGGLGDAAPELALHQRVQPAGRFVEHQQRRTGGERRDECHLLPVARRVGAGPLAGVELEPGDQLRAVGQVRACSDTGEQVQALLTRHRRPEGDVGRHVGEMPVRLFHVADPVAEDPGGTGGRAEQPEQQTDGGRLARAVRAEETEDLAGRHREGQVVHREGGREALAQVLHAHGGSGSRNGDHGDPPIAVGNTTADQASRRTGSQARPDGPDPKRTSRPGSGVGPGVLHAAVEPERLLQHHRGELSGPGTVHVAVAERVPDLVVDDVVAVVSTSPS